MALLAGAALLAGCNTLLAQNPSSPLQPVNAVRSGDESRLMLRGYDVVAYVTLARAVPGSPRHRAEFEGAAYYFSSAEHLAQFQLDPAKAAFELDLKGNIALADKYWKDEVSGRNSAWQSLRRRVDRVPHYRSRDELAAAVAAAQAKPS